MTKSFLISLGAVALLSACSPDGGQGTGGAGSGGGVDPLDFKPAVELSGRSSDDVIKLKYKKAQVICSLWVQKNKKLDTTLSPESSFVWDLKKGLQLPRQFKLEGSADRIHSAQAEFSFEEVSIVDGLLRQDFEGHMYEILYTPVVKVALTSKTLTNFPSGAASSEHSGSPLQIFEKTQSPQLDSSLGLENGLAYRNFIRCDFETEIYPAYQNQFKVIN